MRSVHHGLFIVPFAIVISTISKVMGTHIFSLLFVCWLVYLYLKNSFCIKIIMFSIITLLGFYLYIPNPFKTNIELSDQGEIIVSGKVISAVDYNNNRTSFQIKDQALNAYFQIVYYSEPSEVKIRSIHHGSQCTIEGKWNRETQPTNPGQFDYGLYLKKQGVIGEIIVEQPEDILCSERSVLSYIHSWRTNILKQIEKKFDKRSSVWIKALLFGERTGLDSQVVEQFQDWGIAHLLAISGLHIGILIGIIYLILVRCNITTKETAQTILIFSLPFYIILAGASASVSRGILTVITLIVFEKFKFHISLLDVFSIVFTLLILFDPYQVYDVGFQFSFLVTFGILLSQRWLNIRSYTFQGLRLSYISQMIITPLQLYYFNQFQPLGMVLNVIIVPFFSVLYLPFLLLMFLSGIIVPKLTSIFELLFLLLENIMVKSIDYIDSMIQTTISTGQLSFIYIIAYYIILFLSMFYLDKKKKLQGFIWGLTLTILLLIPSIFPYFKNEGIVTMLDVGQGDTLVIELPKREAVILYDVGALFSFQSQEVSRRVYDQVIKPFLEYQRIKKIDCIFISHEDLDHDGSLPFILQDYEVTRVVVGPYYKPSKEIVEAFRENDVTVEVMYPGEKLTVGKYYFKALSPLTNTNSANENSLVIQTNLGGAEWLLTGDIGSDTERKLIKEYSNLEIDILRVGHHGSKNSTDEAFIRHIQPRYGLISAGKDNRYGHPAKEVLDILEENDVKVFRTDIEGAIQFKFMNRGGTFIPFLQ